MTFECGLILVAFTSGGRSAILIKFCTILFVISLGFCNIYGSVKDNVHGTGILGLPGISVCEGFRVGAGSCFLRNSWSIRPQNDRYPLSHTPSSRVVAFGTNDGLTATGGNNVDDSFQIPQESAESGQNSDGNAVDDAEPLAVTEKDLWNMKTQLAHDATMGLDWVKTIERLQSSENATVSPLTIAFNSALSAAEKNCNADMCLDLMEEMRHSEDSVADAVSYKLTILACVKANRVEDALRLQDEMVDAGMALDHGTIRSLLWLLSGHGHGDRAIKLFEALTKISEMCQNEKGLLQTDYLHTIEACLMSGMLADAEELYEKLKKSPSYKLDPRVLRALLEVAHSRADARMCMELYAEAVKQGDFELAPAHYKLILNTLLLKGEFGYVDQLWKQILNGVTPIDEVVCQLVMQSYAATGNFEKANGLLELMEKERLARSYHPYLLAIKSCEKCGEWKLALKMLRMAEHRLERKEIELYNGVLAVCTVAKEWDTMVSLHQELEEADAQPTGDTVAYMLMAYYNLDHQEKARTHLAKPVTDTPLLAKLRKAMES